MVKSTGIQEDDDEEFKVMLRDLLDDGYANCDMDYGSSRNGRSGFTQVRSDGIEEDDEIRMMLRDFLDKQEYQCALTTSVHHIFA